MSSVIALTGPVQSGKIQLTDFFRRSGWRFVDLNDAIYDNRALGTPGYDEFQKLMPGCIDAEGVENASFYKNITPELFRKILEDNMSLVMQAAKAACCYNERIILSWEYLDLIWEDLPLDKTLVFLSSKDIWYERLRARAKELSGGRWTPSDDWLDQLIRTIAVHPARYRALLSFPDMFLVDTSSADWGLENLSRVLKNFD